MPLLRITKRYKQNSKLAGIIEVDTVEVARADADTFVRAVNSNRRQTYEIIDYEWALIGGANEIIENPTEGYVGRMKNGRPDPK